MTAEEQAKSKAANEEYLRKWQEIGGGPILSMVIPYATTNGTPDTWMMHGLTKREHIAAMALQGLLAYGAMGSYTDNSEQAVRYADALLERLKK